MVRKFSLLPLIAVIVVAAALALWNAPQGPHPAQAAVINVCPGATDFSDIQAAINSGSTVAGDIIELCEGTYTENAVLTIGKDVTVRNASGANVTLVRPAGADGVVVDFTVDGASLLNGGGGGTFTIRNDDTTSGNGVISVAAGVDTVTIDGVTLRHACTVSGCLNILQTQGTGGDTMVFQNNVVFGPGGTDAEFGETLDFVRLNSGSGTGFTIDSNTVHGAGIAYQGAGTTADPTLITNNTFDSDSGTRAAGQVLQVGQGGANTSWVEVTSNTITGVPGNGAGTNISAILLGGQNNGTGTVADITITNNTVSGVVCDAIEINQFSDPADKLTFSGITISSNTLTNNTCSGIFVNSDLDTSGGTANAHIPTSALLVECNDITSNTRMGFEDDDLGTFTAEKNWWGSASGPKGTNTLENTTGVDDVPFLTESFATASECAAVTPPAGTILVCRPPFTFAEIQATIDDAGTVAGNTIEICGGTYTEDAVLDISKDITITNKAGEDVVLVRPNAGSPDGAVVDFTADGASLVKNSTGTFTVKNDDTSAGNGVINVALGIDNLTIDGITLQHACTVSGCLNILQMQGAVGSAGDGMTFKNNTVTGPAGTDTDNGETLDFVRGSSGSGTGFLIDNNTLHGAGIAYQGVGTGSDPSFIKNNTIDSGTTPGDNAAGQVIQVGQGGVNTSWVEVTGNTITGNAGAGAGTHISAILLGGQSNVTGIVDNITIKSNTVSGVVCDAIEINQFSSPADELTFSNITIRSNTLNNNTCAGIFVNSDLDGSTGNDSIAAADLLVLCNDITANNLGFEDGDNGTFIAEKNWWGNAGGPGAGGANDNTSNVDDAPFLTETFVTAAQCQAPGDYDGDGDSDTAIWRPSTNTWYIKDQATVQWGASSARDTPVPGDYDGDGDTDPAIWRRSSNTWYINNQATVQWGAAFPGDLPVSVENPVS